MYLKLYENIKICKGVKRHSLLDLQKNLLYFIPLHLVEQLENQKVINGVNHLINNDMIKQMLDRQILKIVHSVQTEKQSKLNFIYPSIISNVIIEFSEITWEYKDYLLEELLNLHCKVLTIVLTSNWVKSDLVDFLEKIDSVQIIVKYDKIFVDELKNLFVNYMNLYAVYITDSPSCFDSIDLTDNFGMTRSFMFTMNQHNIRFCGQIETSFFLVNYQFYAESLANNSCLNKKLSIDTEGNIKNCPSMKESFGNIKDTTLTEAIEKQGFKKYWNINKDKIHVCKDCEFRYICTDCRAYVEDPEDILSKPLKCGYNPYTGEWDEWSTNPLKQKVIDFYGMREMVEEKNASD